MYPDFNSIKMQYAWGPAFMTSVDVADYVSFGTITPAQYKEITGLDFTTEEAAPASESTSTAPVESASESEMGSLSDSTSASESAAQ